VKIVHAADLHIDSPLRGLDRYEGAPVERIRNATRAAVENLVQLCLDEKARLLLIAGDVYDGAWRDFKTGLYFAKQMSRLRLAGVRVVMVRGNHDAESTVHKHLKLPDNVVELSPDKAETRVFDELGVAVHGQSYGQREVTTDLSLGYPAAVPGLVNFGLLHTAASGREGHLPYAPCAVETLRQKGYDYWALGHVHAREVLSTEPWIVFSGNLQGRHARETGAKGATLITVEDGRISAVEARALDVVRWAQLEVDIGGAADADEVLARVAAALSAASAEAGDGRLLAARLTVAGSGGAHATLVGDSERWEAELRRLGSECGDGESVWLEKIRFATRAPIDAAALAARQDAVGEVVRALAALGKDTASLRALCESELAELKAKLPEELRDELLDDAALAAAVGEVEQLLLPRLVGADGETP
jgi:DNA repair exonuclease SbcCD nuclease subunit